MERQWVVVCTQPTSAYSLYALGEFESGITNFYPIYLCLFVCLLLTLFRVLKKPHAVLDNGDLDIVTSLPPAIKSCTAWPVMQQHTQHIHTWGYILSKRKCNMLYTVQPIQDWFESHINFLHLWEIYRQYIREEMLSNEYNSIIDRIACGIYGLHVPPYTRMYMYMDSDVVVVLHASQF